MIIGSNGSADGIPLPDRRQACLPPGPTLPARRIVIIARLNVAQPRALPILLVAAALPRGSPALICVLPSDNTGCQLVSVEPPNHASRTLLATLAVTGISSIEPAFAHGFAGPHMFISTVLIDDPNVADEAACRRSLLAATDRWRPDLASTSMEFEFDKRITENFGFSWMTATSGYGCRRQDGQRLAKLGSWGSNTRSM